jgi:hypothetical protein
LKAQTNPTKKKAENHKKKKHQESKGNLPPEPV